MIASSDAVDPGQGPRPLRRAVRILILLPFVLATALCETTYCAFEVRVTTPSGTPFARVPVYLIRAQRTTLFSTSTDEAGIAKLCDAPVGAVDIGVGFDVCGSVLLRAIRATWPDTKTVFVTYSNDPCRHFTFESRCLTVLRIQSEAGRPIAGAHFRTEGGDSGLRASDMFGRIFYKTNSGGRVAGLVIKKGYRAARVSKTCIDDNDKT